MGCTGSSARENIDFGALRKKREEELQKIKKEMEDLKKKEEKVEKEIEELKKKEIGSPKIELEQKINEGFSNDNKEEAARRINDGEEEIIKEEEKKIKEEEERKIKEEEERKIKEEEERKIKEEEEERKIKEEEEKKIKEEEEKKIKEEEEKKIKEEEEKKIKEEEEKKIKEEEEKKIKEEEEKKIKEEEERKRKEEEEKKIKEEEERKRKEEEERKRKEEEERKRKEEDEKKIKEEKEKKIKEEKAKIEEDEKEFERLKNEEISSIIPTDVKTPSKNCIFLGVFGDIRTDKQASLDRLNAIRKEACEEGVKDPQTKKKLTMSDYFPLKWSTDLEKISRIRAAESSFTIGHERLNGKSIWGVVFNNVRSWGENLAWNWGSANSINMINQWYSEKHDWVTGGRGVTGHYESIISTGYKYVGLGWFYNEIAKYPNTLCGSFSHRGDIAPEDFLDGKSNIIQTIEITKKKVERNFLEGKAKMLTGESQILTPKVKISGGYGLLPLNRYTTLSFKSDNNKIAKVSKYGKVTAYSQGTAKITCIKSDKSTFSTFEIKVICNHEKKLIKTVKPTCTKVGKNTYECKICNIKKEEDIKIIPHDYTFNLNKQTYKSTGTCKVCKKKINFKVPSSMEVFWRNNETAKNDFYYDSVPNNNPVGSIIVCWTKGINGDSDYRQLCVEISDTSILEYPSEIGDFTEFKVLKKGEVQITIYTKYNTNLRKTFTLSVG